MTCYLTPFQIEGSKTIDFPLATIEQVEKFGGGTSKGTNSYGLNIQLKVSLS